jgi:predicted DNA-binding transcriptional regulator AlpA
MPKMLSIVSLLTSLDISRTTFHRLRKNAGFPAPVIMHGKIQRWSEEDVEAWLSKRREKGTPEAI